MNIDRTLPDYSLTLLIRLLTTSDTEDSEREEVARDYAKLFSLATDTPPLDEMAYLLDRDGVTKIVSADCVARQWYTMKFHRTAAYSITTYLGATPYPPNEQDIHSATTELLAQKKVTLDALNFTREERDLKNVLPDDVIHVWNTCRAYGIEPWKPLNMPLPVVEYSQDT